MKAIASNLRIAAAFVVAVVHLLYGVCAHSQTLVPLIVTGPTDQRINVVVLSEGYTKTQLSQFTNNAGAFMRQWLKTPPMSSYPEHYNFFAISVASSQAGADHPSRNIYRTTYFNSTFESYGSERLLTIPPNDRNGNYDEGEGKVLALLQQLVPDYDIVVLLVNDDEYGGSGGSVAVTSLNVSSAEIAIHEVGHSYADLGDEYAEAYPGFPDAEEPNTTRQTDRNQLKWKDWVAPSTPLPTPDIALHADEVGLFEGAHYHDAGWFRPEHDCLMRTLGTGFCRICSEALVLEDFSRISAIDFHSPSESFLSVGRSELVAFWIQPLGNSNHVFTTEWWVDDVITPAASRSFELSSRTLSSGLHAVKARLTLSTAVVRTDPLHLLRSEVSWTIVVESPPPARFVLPLAGTNGAILLQVVSDESVPLVLEASDTLKDWVAVQTNAPAATGQFRVAPSAAARFYRLRQ